MPDLRRYRKVWQLQGLSLIRDRDLSEEDQVVSGFMFGEPEIERLLRDPYPRQVLLDVFRDLTGFVATGRGSRGANDGYVKSEIAQAFRFGRLVLVKRRFESSGAPAATEESSQGSARPERAPAAAPAGGGGAPPPPVKTFIAFELVDQSGSPVPNERYKLKLTDGSIREGRLDANGSVRVTGIDPGNCEITFPDLDEKDVKPA